MDAMTLWQSIRLRHNTERLMRRYAVRTWWTDGRTWESRTGINPRTVVRYAPSRPTITESESRLMDGNR
jgi:hypothetical protein